MKAAYIILWSIASAALATNDSEASSWRVTPSNPVRFANKFDWERCAALHKEILEYGWKMSNKPLQDLPTKTWWDVFGSNVSDASPNLGRLSQPLTKFLKQATEAEDHYFFYYTYGLMGPDGMFQNHEGFAQYRGADRDRFLVSLSARKFK
jgi:hypothetical protein